MKIINSIFFLIITIFIISCSYKTQNEVVKPDKRGDSSFFPSYQEIKSMKEEHLERELEKTISGFQGIKGVRIHISLKDSRVTASDNAAHSKAAVVIWVDKSSPREVKKIKSVVAAASLDLEKEYVDVIENNAALLTDRSQKPEPYKNNFRLILVVLLTLCLSAAGGLLVVGMAGLKRNKQIQKKMKINDIENGSKK
ncbi:MAG: hypothetical protein JXR91_11580 [Deltaproteobacteria bacterium]|nr:hypothetical protein [Deltaproteobacteria bacterium]